MRRRIIAAAAVFLGIFLLSAFRPPPAPRMSKEELRNFLESPEVIVIDVRQEADWKNSKTKIKGAVREDPNEAASLLNKYPKDKTLVFYCE